VVPPDAGKRPTGTYFGLTESFKRSLLAENKSPRTVETYGEALRLFGDFLLEREHVEAFIADLLAKWKPATASNRYRALHSFFKWAVAEEEIAAHPMANMKPPAVPEEPPQVLTDDDIKRLLRACEGTGFAERRDAAIIRLLYDTGMRRAECAHLNVADIDFEHNVALVLGKGRRPRACPFGRKTAQALDRYLRARAGRKESARAELWLGLWGPMTESGLYQVLEKRAEQAKIGPIHTHLFPALFRPHLARQRRPGGRSDTSGRLALPDHAQPLRRQRRR
jgi:site-specific recombinase XerD